MSSSQTPIRQDEELFLRYGGHSNRTLFVEYGFINQWETGQCYKGDFAGEVDLQDVVEQLFEKMSRRADLAKEILEDEGYWGYTRSCILRRAVLIYNFYSHQPPQRLDLACGTSTRTSVIPIGNRATAVPLHHRHRVSRHRCR